MTDIIYDYPKSSCDCWKCNQDKCNQDNYNQDNCTSYLDNSTNMYFNNHCIFSKYNDCYDKNTFRVDKEPFYKSGNVILNPSVLTTDKFDKTFKAVNTEDCPNSFSGTTTYISSDPRLYNQGGTWLQLDRPPLNSTIKLSSLNIDKSLNNYGKGYTSYSDINTGQYVYYINKEREDPFYKPLFSKEAISIGTMYKDPMGSIKPQYNRIPLNQNNETDETDETNEYALSFMKDTQFHREDILALQMRKKNEQRYEPLWGSN